MPLSQAYMGEQVCERNGRLSWRISGPFIAGLHHWWSLQTVQQAEKKCCCFQSGRELKRPSSTFPENTSTSVGNSMMLMYYCHRESYFPQCKKAGQ